MVRSRFLTAQGRVLALPDGRQGQKASREARTGLNRSDRHGSGLPVHQAAGGRAPADAAETDRDLRRTYPEKERIKQGGTKVPPSCWPASPVAYLGRLGTFSSPKFATMA